MIDPRSTESAEPNDNSEKPFQVTLRQDSVEPIEETATDGEEFFEDQLFSLDDIESAYLKALESSDFGFAELEQDADFPAAEPEEDPLPVGTNSGDLDADEQSEIAFWNSEPSEVLLTSALEDTSSSEPSQQVQVDFSIGTEQAPRISQHQVLEAVLFVGGANLTIKKILDILGETLTFEQLDGLVAELNQRYADEGRPYEIHLTDDSYLMQLRHEFEPVRSRFFGHGPKEVKLAQDALEVLALVAYLQPVTKERMDESEKPNLPGLLRQLLRRQLICLDRQNDDQVAKYRTTSRFLSLFGLKSLDDLPQVGDFNFK